MRLFRIEFYRLEFFQLENFRNTFFDPIKFELKNFQLKRSGTHQGTFWNTDTTSWDAVCFTRGVLMAWSLWWVEKDGRVGVTWSGWWMKTSTNPEIMLFEKGSICCHKINLNKIIKIYFNCNAGHRLFNTLYLNSNNLQSWGVRTRSKQGSPVSSLCACSFPC